MYSHTDTDMLYAISHLYHIRIFSTNELQVNVESKKINRQLNNNTDLANAFKIKAFSCTQKLW